MRNVKLYGHMGTQFGRTHLLDVASAAEAAAHFGISTSTVKRYCRIHKVRSALDLGGTA